jgi:anthranilate/para-aminobenzoate synthase component II
MLVNYDSFTYNLIQHFGELDAAQRLALPAGGRDETTPLCRNPLQATQSA